MNTNTTALPQLAAVNQGRDLKSNSITTHPYNSLVDAKPKLPTHGQSREGTHSRLMSREDDGYLEENEDDEENSDEEDTFAEKDDRGDFKILPNVGGIDLTASKVNQDQTIKYQPVIVKDNLSDLSKPLPLVPAGHSLLPDMQFGWKPQADKEIPPIPFCFGLVYYNLEQFNYPKALYVGPRFTNSYKMHEQYANKLMQLPIQSEDGENMSIYAYPFTFPKFYSSNNPSYEEAFTQFVESMENDSAISDQNLNFQLPSKGKNGQKGEQNTLLTALSFKEEREEFVFDSNFESGNLDFVGKVTDNEYDLLMRLDSNSRSHQQWFYFSIDCKDIKRRCTKGETIKLTIMNFTKPNSLYNQGMRPVAWSKMKCMKEGLGWHRVGQNIVYKLSKLCRNQQYSGGRIWYQMSFEYTFEYDEDKVWFAYAIPYSFTMLSNFIKAIEETQKKPENMKKSHIFKKETLGKSLSGVEIPFLTITDFNETNKRKKTIVMVGRLHPGETHSSWLVHGFIRFLLSNSLKARELRKKVVFKIVPMLNPDGVIIGNYRCTLAGCDMNRNFGGETELAQRLNPETHLFKKMAKSQNRQAFFFDVHSHSSKKSVFIYGPYFPLHSEHYLKIRVLPRLLTEKTTMFRYYSCRFRNEQHKMHCSRLTIFRECNLPQCYTIETSIMGFLNKDRQNVSFGIPSLQYFGEKLGETLLEWFQIVEAHQREKIKKAIMMSKQRKSRKRTIIDIIGEEDYDEYKDVIDNQIVLSQQQESEEPQLQRKQTKTKKQRKKSLTKGNTLIRKKTQLGGNNLPQSTTQQYQVIGSTSDAYSGEQSSTAMQNNKELIPGLENIQVKLLEENLMRKHLKETSTVKKTKQDGNSSDDEEEEEDNYSIHNGASAMQTLKPKMYHESHDSGNSSDETNLGFFVPKLAGFEYLEGSQSLQLAAKQLKDKLFFQQTGHRNLGLGSRANGDLLLSGSDLNGGKFNVLDDDEQFIYEDQIHQQEGDSQPLRRLEDIVGEIKKDLIKANNGANNFGSTTQNNMLSHNVGQGHSDSDLQFYDEKDLDSQGSDEDKEVDPGVRALDQEYDNQMIKMQECLVSYWDNVEDLQKLTINGNRPLTRTGIQTQVSVKKMPNQQPVQQTQPLAQPISVVIKETKTKVDSSQQSSPLKPGSPTKGHRSSLLQQQVKPQQEVLIPQKKEIVFQLKKGPTITNFPPDKPKTALVGSRAATVIQQYPPANNSSSLFQRGLVGSSPVNAPIVSKQNMPPPLDPKDLSFTLMNKSNQEFFDLLSRYVQTKGPAPGTQTQYHRAQSAIQGNKQNSSQQNFFSQNQKQNKNQQLLQQMQQQQQQIKKLQPNSSNSNGQSSRNPYQSNQLSKISPDQFTRNNYEKVELNSSMIKVQLEGNGSKSAKKVAYSNFESPLKKSQSRLNTSQYASDMSTTNNRSLSQSKAQYYKKLHSMNSERNNNHPMMMLMVDGKSVPNPFQQRTASPDKKNKYHHSQYDSTGKSQKLFDSSGKSSFLSGNKSFAVIVTTQQQQQVSQQLSNRKMKQRPLSYKPNGFKKRVQYNPNVRQDEELENGDTSKRSVMHSRHSSNSMPTVVEQNERNYPSAGFMIKGLSQSSNNAQQLVNQGVQITLGGETPPGNDILLPNSFYTDNNVTADQNSPNNDHLTYVFASRVNDEFESPQLRLPKQSSQQTNIVGGTNTNHRVVIKRHSRQENQKVIPEGETTQQKQDSSRLYYHSQLNNYFESDTLMPQQPNLKDNLFSFQKDDSSPSPQYLRGNNNANQFSQTSSHHLQQRLDKQSLLLRSSGNYSVDPRGTYQDEINSTSPVKGRHNNMPLPMKNQLLIDMFRSAASTSSGNNAGSQSNNEQQVSHKQQQRSNQAVSMNLQPQAAALMVSSSNYGSLSSTNQGTSFGVSQQMMLKQPHLAAYISEITSQKSNQTQKVGQEGKNNNSASYKQHHRRIVPTQTEQQDNFTSYMQQDQGNNHPNIIPHNATS